MTVTTVIVEKKQQKPQQQQQQQQQPQQQQQIAAGAAGAPIILLHPPKTSPTSGSSRIKALEEALQTHFFAHPVMVDPNSKKSKMNNNNNMTAARLKHVGTIFVHDAEWLARKALSEEEMLRAVIARSHTLRLLEQQAETLDRNAFARHPMWRYAAGSIVGLFVGSAWRR